MLLQNNNPISKNNIDYNSFFASGYLKRYETGTRQNNLYKRKSNQGINYFFLVPRPDALTSIY